MSFQPGDSTIVLRRWLAAWAVAAALGWPVHRACGAVLPTANGFYGIWYAVGASGDQYAYKYSGGLGTYTHQTSPLAIYAEAINRTYFVYGGTNGTNNTLKNFISYYDHTSGLLARPREVRHVGGSDNHRNITFTIDDDGYLNVFGNSHGDGGTGNLYRSTQPYAIAEFDEVALPASVFGNTGGKVVLSYSHPFHVPGSGFTMVYNQYHDGRAVHVARSADGATWIDQALFDTNQGHYTLARQNGSKIGVTADYHRGGSLDNRTNLYYFESNDAGQTWTNAAGAAIAAPATTVNNPALVHDYLAENQLVYMKDIDYDASGNPILMYLTVSDATGNGHRSGPQPGGRTIHTAHWTGGQWQIRDVMNTDHNYDHGELYVEADGTWRIIAPFFDGPQQYGTGGEVGMWTSQNEGASWQLVEQLTEESTFNHTYVRQPIDAHEDFYAYWADGNAFAQSASRLHFATKDGTVYRMPTNFAGEFAAPEELGVDPPPPPPPVLRAYEGFDYPNDGPAIADRNGGSGWNGAWVDDDADFVNLSGDDVSLSSPASPFASRGDRLEGPGAGEASRALAHVFDLSEEGATMYVSFLMKKLDGSAATGDNLEINLNSGGAQVVRFGAGSTEQFFLGSSANPFGATEIGDTYFLVLKAVASAAGSDEFFAKVYGDAASPPASEPGSWDAVLTLSSDAIVDAIRLARGANATGAFDEIRVGENWSAVAAAPPGDFNGDGFVDGDDLDAWKLNFGATGANLSMGDADRDGDVDGADFLAWQRGVSIAATAAAAANLPEPASLMLGMAGCAFMAACRRNRPRTRGF